MSTRSSLALLIIAYRRVKTLGRILETACASGVTNVYIVIDKSPREEFSLIQEEIFLLCEKYRLNFLSMNIIKRDWNVGCAASVLTGLDWIFSQEDFACVLEDDCIPTPDFFKFSLASREVLKLDKDVLLACGTQFAPKNLSNEPWIKSKYALTWGWSTTKENWSLIRSLMFRTEGFHVLNARMGTLRNLLNPEERYWRSGARRARSGYVDVWDTILLRVMQVSNKYALLPAESLVTNVGDDANATHTRDSEWTNKPAGTFLDQHSQPKTSTAIDLWLKRNFFKISARHLVSTRITQIIDFFRTPLRPPLEKQFTSNQITER